MTLLLFLLFRCAAPPEGGRRFPPNPELHSGFVHIPELMPNVSSLGIGGGSE